MSDISYQLQSSLTLGTAKSLVRDQYVGPSDTVTQDEEKVFRNVHELGITAEQLSVGGITTPGLAVFENHDATNDIEVGGWYPGDGLPANSTLRIASGGEAYFLNPTTGLWNQFQVDGPDGNVYSEVGQTGQSLPIPSGAFYPFLKIKPGERQLCRIAILAASLYARGVGGLANLFYIVYED